MTEIKAPDIRVINLPDYTDKREKHYLVDPCDMRWPKSVRILAYVYLIKQGRLAARGPKPLTRSIAKTANATNLKESCPLKPSLEDSNETSAP